MFSSAGTPPPKAARTPRRAGTRAARAASAALQSGETTPRGSPPPALSGRSLGHGLLTANRALSAAGSASRRGRSVASVSEAGSGMDLDEQRERTSKEEQDKMLVKDESYVVLEKRGLPQEVQEVIRAADPYTEPFRATLDSQTGFALLVSKEHCLVWNWSKRSSSATTYIFPLSLTPPLPTNVTAFAPLSYASFVPSPSPSTSQREPGLLTISTTGAIRYWESISMSLSGVERFKALQTPLLDGELVRDLKMLSPTSYIASTSQARLILVGISSVGGRVAVNARALERAVGWAGSVWSAVFGAGKQVDPRAGVLALALSPASEGKSFAYALTEKNLQKWEMPTRDDGGERLVVEQDVFAAVLEGLSGDKVGNEEWAMNEGRVEIVDAAVVPSSGNLAVLVSHVADWTLPNASSYAIVLLAVGSTQNSVEPVGVRHVAYQAHPDPRPLSSPKLSLAGGDTAFVTFVDAVVMLSLAPESAFEESFPLRSNTHRFLGLSPPSFVPSPSGIETLSLLTSTSTILVIQVSPPQIAHTFAPGSEGHKTRKLKTKIEQAIYFGAGDEENPLAFDMQPDFEGDLLAATEAVSAEILSSSSPNMPLILDLRAQLADRIQRSRALIEYISGNGLLAKLPQSSRRKLSWDAERLVAAAAVWHHLNSRLGTNESLLADSISAFMDDAGEGLDEDPLRTFFRTKVASLGAILELVNRYARNFLAEQSTTSESRSIVLQEANHVLLTVFDAVARHRKDTASHYGLDPSLLPIEPWSSQSVLLDSLQWHFESTDALLKERVRDFGTSLEEEQTKFGASDLSSQPAMQGELKRQMASLAEYVFSMFEERILHLESINSESQNSPYARALNERYLSLRSHLLRILVVVGKVNNVYELAERHGDFRALVELSTNAKHGSTSRIQFFMGKYAEDFAFELYQFYIEQSELRTLLEQSEAYRPLLTKFLDSTDNPHLSWLNDVAIGRFGHATDVLVTEATKEQNLAQKKLMLSLGKLAQVAQATSETIHTQDVQRAISTVDDLQDLVGLQERLAESFAGILSGSESRLPIEQRSEVVASRVAPVLADRQAFAQLYCQLVAKVLQGRSLEPEDLVDLLTLKENVGDQQADYMAALQTVIRAEEVPEARKEIMLKAIWRRIYLRDDWAALRSAVGLRDEELAESLRSTALYATLEAASSESLPSNVFLSAGESLFSGTAEEVAARFPALPPQSIEELLSDYQRENQELLEVIQQHGIESFAKEIERLVQEGRVEEGDDDESMAE